MAQSPSLPGSSTDATRRPPGGSVVLRLDPAFDPGRLLEALEHQGPVSECHGSGAAFRRLVRRIPTRGSGELRRHDRQGRFAGGTALSAHGHRPVGSSGLGARIIKPVTAVEGTGAGRQQPRQRNAASVVRSFPQGLGQWRSDRVAAARLLPDGSQPLEARVRLAPTSDELDRIPPWRARHAAQRDTA
ncbi:Uncharacterised protein [Mycobacteroides abscessus subsp. abscessus]|nr:Uncharacterised protein [Mycobacteroides abscessus subsp. abscessus]